jgi:hypothetical protein
MNGNRRNIWGEPRSFLAIIYEICADGAFKTQIDMPRMGPFTWDFVSGHWIPPGGGFNPGDGTSPVNLPPVIIQF